MSDNARAGYTVGSLFAGIGGICIGFSSAGCDVKWANELDKNACNTYRKNKESTIGNVVLHEKDICSFVPDPKVRIDILTGGFPCQPYSQAGHRRGLDDSRGRPMFKQMLRIAQECKPRVIFMENVSVLKTLEKGSIFSELMKLLEEAGYANHPDYILNSKDHSGIAQFRNRIYIVAFRDETDYKSFKEKIGDGPEKITMTINKQTIVNSAQEAEEKYYYSGSDKNKCFSKRYNEHFEEFVTDENVIYQYRRTYMRDNKNGLCPALTASMGGGGHNVPIIKDDFGIRKLTPSECLRFQGFPDTFEFPETISDSQKYKQIGNSVTIPVVECLAKVIVESLRDVDLKKENTA